MARDITWYQHTIRVLDVHCKHLHAARNVQRAARKLLPQSAPLFQYWAMTVQSSCRTFFHLLSMHDHHWSWAFERRSKGGKNQSTSLIGGSNQGTKLRHSRSPTFHAPFLCICPITVISINTFLQTLLRTRLRPHLLGPTRQQVALCLKTENRTGYLDRPAGSSLAVVGVSLTWAP